MVECLHIGAFTPAFMNIREKILNALLFQENRFYRVFYNFLPVLFAIVVMLYNGLRKKDI